MASVNDYGAPTDPRSGATSPSAWAAAVAAALDGDDTTVDARIAAAVPTDVTDLSSGAASALQVPLADGSGGIAWGDQTGSGGGAPLSDADPADLGTTGPGVGTSASRDDHVHAMPSAADVGAAAASHTHGLADVTDAGGAAALDVGTTAGTVAAGDDSRIVGAVQASLFDANTILAANSDNAPAALTVAEQRLVGRITGGNIDDLTGEQVNALLSGQSDVNTVASSGATETLPATFEFHDVTMSEACEFTFAAPSSDGHAFVLVLRGAFTPTFPASVDWSGGSAPTYTTPAVYTFVTVDKGVTWLGSQAGKAYS